MDSNSRPDRPGITASRTRKFQGIKRKTIVMLVGMLAFITVLNASLIIYLTNHDDKAVAFSRLRRDLGIWQDDLKITTRRLKGVALNAVADFVERNLLVEIARSGRRGPVDPGMSEAKHRVEDLGFSTMSSLARLDVVLRAGDFSSIAVYIHGRLNHYISTSQAGMVSQDPGGKETWVAVPLKKDSDRQFQNWATWTAQSYPLFIDVVMPAIDKPVVSFRFLSPSLVALQIAVPVSGAIGAIPEFMDTSASTSAGPEVEERARTGVSAPGDQRPAIFGLVVFRKVIGLDLLQDLARTTGSTPVMYSPRGRHVLQLFSLAPIRGSLFDGIWDSPASAAKNVIHRTSGADKGAYYLALLPWYFDGIPQLVLGMASSRDDTVQAIRQSVTAIVAIVTVILLLGAVIGWVWIGKIVAPIVALTDAVEGIAARGRNGLTPPDSSPLVIRDLRNIDTKAPDEAGELARTFNALIEELQDAFESLEHRVQTRTAELNQQTLYMRALIDNIPVFVWLKNIDGRYLAANLATARACGRTVDDVVGKTDAEVWPAALAEQYMADDRAVIAAGQQITVEENVADSNGAVWVETYKAPVLGSNGSVIGTVGFARDIGGRKALETAREAALIEAERLARVRSEFVAQMSHELRTPLNAVLGCIQLLRRDPDLSIHQKEGLWVIKESGEHLLALINDILDLSRIEAGKAELCPTDIDFRAFLRVVADIARIKADQKGLSFSYTAAPELPALVRVDEIRLRQVLLNLLDNAVKFTDSGKVELHVASVQRVQRVHSGAANETVCRLRFAVQDTGIGMTEEDMSRIFLPFEQLVGAERREGGTGLGLAISEQLVRWMGGEDIQVQTRAGVGSCFWFDLEVPVSPSGESSPNASRVISGYAGPRRTVLVVDDVGQNRQVFARLLSSLGFVVIEAENGRQALESISQIKPDLIVMDVMMPVMDGVETIRRMRQGLAPMTIIIAVSASACQTDRRRSLEAGADAFISKPVDLDGLLMEIGERLGLTWLHEAPAAHPAPAGPHGELVAPPPDEMAALHRLALEGNMRDIRIRADHLAALDPRFIPFAERLRRFAEEYQTRAIVKFVERHMTDGA